MSLSLFAQAPTVPYAQFFGPDFDNIRVDHAYLNRDLLTRKVNFRNMRLIVFDQSGNTDTVLQLKDGVHKWKEKGGEADEAKIEEVDYLTPADATGAEYAVVLLHWRSVAGGADTDGYAQVFRLTDHDLRVTQQLRWNEQFETKDKYTFDAATKTLIARSAHYLPGDAHCCISAMDVYTLQWNGSAFVQKAVTTELSDYGKKEGKQLPH